MIAGNFAAREKVLPVLVSVINKSKIDSDKDVGEDMDLKICGSYSVSGVIEVVAEGMTLGRCFWSWSRQGV